MTGQTSALRFFCFCSAVPQQSPSATPCVMTPSQWGCLLIISCIYNWRSTRGWRDSSTTAAAQRPDELSIHESSVKELNSDSLVRRSDSSVRKDVGTKKKVTRIGGGRKQTGNKRRGIRALVQSRSDGDRWSESEPRIQSVGGGSYDRLAAEMSQQRGQNEIRAGISSAAIAVALITYSAACRISSAFGGIWRRVKS